ncbi:bestrophin family protein [Roseomonas sp. 18066]|uniref:bestrophin family protein n=1 Tax=Roseomonas sp. 18066 TaxID=2681412 RepID=UPI00135C3901|nr:bestrophin family ion channel [Roseomonas sp. 18066]
MIIPTRTQFHRMLRYLGWPLVIFLVWDIAITLSYSLLHSEETPWDLPMLPLPLLGSALVLFLGIRNNSAYARWWEARTLWGAMVNASRSYTRQALSFIEDSTEGRQLVRRLVCRQIAYVHALRCALRRQDPWPEVARFLTAPEAAALRGHANLPNAILNGSARLLAEAARKGRITEFRHTQIERLMVDFSNAQGGMERIKNTPLPRPYTLFPRFFCHVFCVLLPVGLVDQLGLYTPLASTVVGLMLLAFEQIGHDLQDPFENAVNDVPMTAICRTIEIDLQQALGDSDASAPTKPDGDVLW